MMQNGLQEPPSQLMLEVQRNMNIEYKVLLQAEEKEEFKDEFQLFFASIYNQKLTDLDWEHQFINSPYNDSPLFLVLNKNKIIGSALMIGQKFTNKEKKGSYYLWTTSAIDKEYRSKGIYAELLVKQREYAEKTNKSFIFAFPNKLAYSVVKLFGGFKDLEKTNLVKTTLEQIDFFKVFNTLVIDKQFFDWRFEHQAYLFYRYENKIIIAKEYEDTLDVLAIYPQEDLEGFAISYREVDMEQKIITIASFLKENNNSETLNQVNGTYFPIDKTVDYSSITINLLMSDVF